MALVGPKVLPGGGESRLMDEFKPPGVQHYHHRRLNLHSLKDLMDEFYARTYQQVRYVIVATDIYQRMWLQAAGYSLSNTLPELRLVYGVHVIHDRELPWGDVLFLYEREI